MDVPWQEQPGCYKAPFLHLFTIAAYNCRLGRMDARKGSSGVESCDGAMPHADRRRRRCQMRASRGLACQRPQSFAPKAVSDTDG